jgi:ABC-type sugar transport system ATPase subunit
VDIPTKRDIYQLLSDLSGRGVTVVFFSSEVEELSEVCHRVAVLRSGSLFAVLRDGEMSADSILAAMFGQAEHSRAAVPPTEV